MYIYFNFAIGSHDWMLVKFKYSLKLSCPAFLTESAAIYDQRVLKAIRNQPKKYKGSKIILNGLHTSLVFLCSLNISQVSTFASTKKNYRAQLSSLNRKPYCGAQ